jgi:hypothetical protein
MHSQLFAIYDGSLIVIVLSYAFPFYSLIPIFLLASRLSPLACLSTVFSEFTAAISIEADFQGFSKIFFTFIGSFSANSRGFMRLYRP